MLNPWDMYIYICRNIYIFFMGIFPPYFLPSKLFRHIQLYFFKTSCAFKVGATGRFEAFLALAYIDESTNATVFHRSETGQTGGNCCCFKQPKRCAPKCPHQMSFASGSPPDVVASLPGRRAWNWPKRRSLRCRVVASISSC